MSTLASITGVVDTHCHLDAQYFPEGPDAVVDRAREAGVGHLVVIGVGEDEGPAERAVELAARRDDVSATVGLHPHDANHLDDALFDRLAVLAPDAVAVGECGLDYFYDQSPREVQRDVFRRMIALARKVQRPIVVHTRDAAADTLAILREEKAQDVGGIIHCFSEDRAFATQALDLGFDVSFSGIVTFKKAAAVREVAAWVPHDRYLVETDSPYLAPVPKRGKRNEPALVVHTAQCVAELRGESYEQVVEATTRNAVRRLRLQND